MRRLSILLLALAPACRGAPARPAETVVTAADAAPRFANSAWRQPPAPRSEISPAAIEIPRFAGGDVPTYPEASVRRNEEGAVDLRFELRENGSVKELGVERSSGFHRLDEAALAAARTWRFNPTTGGLDLEVVRYRMQFRLVDALADR